MKPDITDHARDSQSPEPSGNRAGSGHRSPPTGRRKRPQEAQAGQRLLDVHQAGLFLAVSPWTVRGLVWSGALPSVRVGRLIRLDLKDLENYITRNKQTSPSW